MVLYGLLYIMKREVDGSLIWSCMLHGLVVTLPILHTGNTRQTGKVAVCPFNCSAFFVVFLMLLLHLDVKYKLKCIEVIRRVHTYNLHL